MFVTGTTEIEISLPISTNVRVWFTIAKQHCCYCCSYIACVGISNVPKYRWIIIFIFKMFKKIDIFNLQRKQCQSLKINLITNILIT